MVSSALDSTALLLVMVSSAHVDSEYSERWVHGCVLAEMKIERSKLLMMKRVVGVIRNKLAYYALRDWECNLQDDNQVKHC